MWSKGLRVRLCAHALTRTCTRLPPAQNELKKLFKRIICPELDEFVHGNVAIATLLDVVLTHCQKARTRTRTHAHTHTYTFLLWLFHALNGATQSSKHAIQSMYRSGSIRHVEQQERVCAVEKLYVISISKSRSLCARDVHHRV